MASNRVRLENDYEKLRELEQRSPLVRILQAGGDPPETYVLELHCKGVVSVDPAGRPQFGTVHRLGLHLHDEYPRKKPLFTMLTPVIHPNIAASGPVCIGDQGDHGWAPGMSIDDLVVKIIEMIRFEQMGLGSPYNLEAAAWARAHQNLFPLETGQIVQEAVDITIFDEPGSAGDLDITIY